MRPWLPILGPFVVCLVLPSRAVAQEAPLLLPAPATPAAWEITWPKGLPAESPALSAQSEQVILIERNPLIDVDFLLGVPTAARVGVAVLRRNEQALVLEGMAGLDYVIVPFLAAGVRYRNVAWHTKQSEAVIKPGVDAYAGVVPPFSGGDRPVFGIGGDVACVFQHNGPHLGWEWGLDLGAIGLIGQINGVAPFVSFLLGFSF